MFTWALEFIAGVTMLVDYTFLGILVSDDYGIILQLLYIGFWGVIIPSSYIIKAE